MDKKSSYLAITAISGALMEQQVTDKILACNQDTAVYGLVLTGQQAVALAHTRTGALKDTKRIEFNSGIIDKLEEMGINEGDTVSILNFEFDYLR